MSVEESLKMLAAALGALDSPGLDKTEVLRLRGIIQGAKVYKDMFADYVDYRRLEVELLELRKSMQHLRRIGNSKTARTFSPDRLRSEWDALRSDAALVEAGRAEVVKVETKDKLEFLTKYCRLLPYWYVLELIKSYELHQFNAVRWPRQTGKSTNIGALHLADAWNNPNFHICFVAQSFRNSKLNLRRVASFCRYLPMSQKGIQKTKITFPNGSIIEAFPANPDTIRGNTFHRVWWDEVPVTPSDEDVYDAILFYSQHDQRQIDSQRDALQPRLDFLEHVQLR